MWRPNRRELLPAAGGALSLRAGAADDLGVFRARAPGNNALLHGAALMPAPAHRNRCPIRGEVLDPPPRRLTAAFERHRRHQPWPFSGLGGPVRLSLY